MVSIPLNFLAKGFIKLIFSSKRQEKIIMSPIGIIVPCVGILTLPTDAITSFNGTRGCSVSDSCHYWDFPCLPGLYNKKSKKLLHQWDLSRAQQREKKTLIPFRLRLCAIHDNISMLYVTLWSPKNTPPLRYIWRIILRHKLCLCIVMRFFSISPCRCCSLESEDSRKSGALHQKRQRYQFNLHNIAGFIPVVHLLV